MEGEITLDKALKLAEPKVDPHEFIILHEQEPVYPVSGWTSDQIQAAIDNHDQGNFQYTELLYHAMRKHARIGPGLETRVHGIRNFPFELEVPHTAPDRIKIETQILQRNFSEVLSEADQSEAVRRTLMFGFCIGRHTCKVVDNQIVPCIRIWTHSNCWYNLSERLFYVTTERGESAPVVGDPWIIFTTGGDRPWLNGLMRPLAMPFFISNFNFDRWDRFNDVEALAYKHISGPRLTREQQETGKLVDVVRQMFGGDTVYTPEHYNFNLVTSQGRGAAYNTFNDLIDRANKDIAIILLGNNLTQEIKAGSLAAAKSAMNAEIRLLQADVTYLGSPLYKDTLRLWIQKNFTPAFYGETSLLRYRPKPKWDVKESDDQQALAKTALDYSMAFQNFITSAGSQIRTLPIDWSEQAKRCGLALKEMDASAKVTENE